MSGFWKRHTRINSRRRCSAILRHAEDLDQCRRGQQQFPGGHRQPRQSATPGQGDCRNRAGSFCARAGRKFRCARGRITIKPITARGQVMIKVVWVPDETAQQMQENMKKMQEQLAVVEVEGQSGRRHGEGGDDLPLRRETRRHRTTVCSRTTRDMLEDLIAAARQRLLCGASRLPPRRKWPA